MFDLTSLDRFNNFICQTKDHTVMETNGRFARLIIRQRRALLGSDMGQREVESVRPEAGASI